MRVLLHALVWLALIFMPLFIGCSSHRQGYTPSELRENLRDHISERRRSDSTVSVRTIFIKGDTVIDRSETERLVTQTVHDTIFVERRVEVKVPVEVERPLTRWEQTKMDFGGMALGGIAVAVCAAVVWLARRFRCKRAC